MSVDYHTPPPSAGPLYSSDDSFRNIWMTDSINLMNSPYAGDCSFVNQLHEQQPQFSYGDVEALRVLSSEGGYMQPQKYRFEFWDPYWDDEESDGLSEMVGNSCLKYLKGKVLSEAADRRGCLLLHRKLHERKPGDVRMIFSEVKDRVISLMYDRFGNYVVQKLFQVCDEEQMTQLVDSITADEYLLTTLCLDSRGSQSVKKFLECLTTQQQMSHMISALRNIALPLINSHFGSWVMRHCLDIFPLEDLEEILDVIADHCLEITTNQHGCYFLQHFVSKNAPHESHQRVVIEVISNVRALSVHQYGNYMVQYVIELGIPYVVEDMVTELRGTFVSLSMDRYGSHVVEKCMKASVEESAPRIITEIISSPYFLSVLLDPYGNYVVQSAKKYATGTIRRTLHNLILLHYEHLHSHPHGKNVLINKERRRNRV